MSASPQNIRKDVYVDGTSPRVAAVPSHTQPNSPTEQKSRPKLSVVTAPLRSSSKGLLFSSVAIMVIAMLCVLVINITVANRQYELLETTQQTRTLSESNEKLASQVAHLSAPQNVAARASELGMVLPATTASIDLTTGTVHGEAAAASKEDVPTDFVSAPTVVSSVGTPVEVPEDRRIARQDAVDVTAEKPAVAPIETAEIASPELAQPGDTAPISSESHNDGADLGVSTIEAPTLKTPGS